MLILELIVSAEVDCIIAVQLNTVVIVVACSWEEVSELVVGSSGQPPKLLLGSNKFNKILQMAEVY